MKGQYSFVKKPPGIKEALMVHPFPGGKQNKFA